MQPSRFLGTPSSCDRGRELQQSIIDSPRPNAGEQLEVRGELHASGLLSFWRAELCEAASNTQRKYCLVELSSPDQTNIHSLF